MHPKGFITLAGRCCVVPLARDITFTVARRVERSLATVHSAGYQEYGFKSKGHIYRSLPYGDDILS